MVHRFLLRFLQTWSPKMKDKKFRRLRIPEHPNPKRQNPGFQDAPEKMDEKMKKKCGQSTGERGELQNGNFTRLRGSFRPVPVMVFDLRFLNRTENAGKWIPYFQVQASAAQSFWKTDHSKVRRIAYDNEGERIKRRRKKLVLRKANWRSVWATPESRGQPHWTRREPFPAQQHWGVGKSSAYHPRLPSQQIRYEWSQRPVHYLDSQG